MFASRNMVETNYFPVHFLPRDSVPLFDKVDKFVRTEMSVLLVSRQEFSSTTNLEVWILRAN